MKPRKCDVCLLRFKPRQHNQKRCSPECADIAKYGDNKNPYNLRKAIKETGNPCDICGKDRGPNYRVCQTCVKARGSYDDSINYVAW